MTCTIFSIIGIYCSFVYHFGEFCTTMWRCPIHAPPTVDLQENVGSMWALRDRWIVRARANKSRGTTVPEPAALLGHAEAKLDTQG